MLLTGDGILLFRPTEALYVCLGLMRLCVGTLIVCFVALCFVVALLSYCLLVSCIGSHCLVVPYLVPFVTLVLLIGCLRFCFVWVSMQNHARPDLYEDHTNCEQVSISQYLTCICDEIRVRFEVRFRFDSGLGIHRGQRTQPL